jgi:hypothetical protein
MAGRTPKRSAKVTKKAAKPRKTAPRSKVRKIAKPILLSGGNPQIAKG